MFLKSCLHSESAVVKHVAHRGVYGHVVSCDCVGRNSFACSECFDIQWRI